MYSLSLGTSSRKIGLASIAVVALSLFLIGCGAQDPVETTVQPKPKPTLHKTIEVDGLDIFYREAGPEGAPTILLLHEFPTSSHMFRNLIPALADRFHLVAPDYPGFGNCEQPSMDDFDYTFERLFEIVEKFTEQLGLDRYSIYLMDYGAPVGFRLAAKHPQRVDALIVQNGNAYEEEIPNYATISSKWRNKCSHHYESSIHHYSAHLTDTTNVFYPVLFRKTQILTQTFPDIITIQYIGSCFIVM